MGKFPNSKKWQDVGDKRANQKWWVRNIKFSTFNGLKTTFSITFTCLSVFSPCSIIGDHGFKPNFAMRLGCVSSVNLNNKSLSPITSVTLLDASNKTAEVCILGGKNQNLSSDLEFRCVFKDHALTRLWSYFIYFPTVFIFFFYLFGTVVPKCPTSVFLRVYLTLEIEINPF